MSENLYYEIFMKQFVQTLAQLTAAAVTTTLAVPLYNYYVKRSLMYNQNQEVDDCDVASQSNTDDDLTEKNTEDDDEVNDDEVNDNEDNQ